jgi:hypothetical protein
MVHELHDDLETLESDLKCTVDIDTDVTDATASLIMD